MNNLVNEITMKFQETKDEFIFQVLSDFALDKYNITIEKEELVRAIQLIRMSKKYGPSVRERWVTATQNAAELERAYDKGYHDGMQEVRKNFESDFKEEKE